LKAIEKPTSYENKKLIDIWKSGIEQETGKPKNRIVYERISRHSKGGNSFQNGNTWYTSIKEKNL
jgi:hypothetical protein